MGGGQGVARHAYFLDRINRIYKIRVRVLCGVVFNAKFAKVLTQRLAVLVV